MRSSLLLSLLTLPSVSAHVGYVVEQETLGTVAGRDYTFLLGALQQYWLLIVVSIIGITLLLVFLGRLSYLRTIGDHLRIAEIQYVEYVPWIARLGLGIALIGAGISNTLISPIVTYPALSTAQILIGFLLLAGLLTGITAWAAALLYAFAIAMNGYTLGNLDFLGLALTVIILRTTRPGIDDLLRIPFMFGVKAKQDAVPLLLRVGIGVGMVFLALYEKILNPHLSELVVMEYNLAGVIPVSPAMWVLAAGAIELAVGLALLIGLRTRVMAGIAFIVLSASFFFFKEAVYSHITLFATLSVLFVLGGGMYSVDQLVKSKGKSF